MQDLSHLTRTRGGIFKVSTQLDSPSMMSSAQCISLQIRSTGVSDTCPEFLFGTRFLSSDCYEVCILGQRVDLGDLGVAAAIERWITRCGNARSKTLLVMRTALCTLKHISDGNTYVLVGDTGDHVCPGTQHEFSYDLRIFAEDANHPTVCVHVRGGDSVKGQISCVTRYDRGLGADLDINGWPQDMKRKRARDEELDIDLRNGSPLYNFIATAAHVINLALPCYKPKLSKRVRPLWSKVERRDPLFELGRAL
jgi:hypothetical protein